MKKQISIHICMMMVLYLVFSQFPHHTEASGYSAKVTTDILNVRSKANTTSSIKFKIKKGTTVTVSSEQGSWSYIIYGKQNGWVSNKYLSTNSLGTYYVTATSLNLREKASSSSKKITSVKKNTALTLLKKSGSWGQVKLSNGTTGWVSLQYLTQTKPAATTNLGTYYVTASSLNLREKASSSSKSIASVKKDTSLTLLKKSGSWGQVKLSNGTTGWVSLQYLSKTKPATAATNIGTYYVTASSLNLREKASSLNSGITGRASSSLLTTKAVKGKTIVIDPGHGGHDSGAIGILLRTKEKDITLSTANQLATLLRNAGANVIMTRSTDIYLSLPARASISNSNKADAFVSIHYNATPISNAYGIETFYYHSPHTSLASSLQQEIAKTTGLMGRGVKKKGYTVLSMNNRPAALVELGFLSTPPEEKIIAQTSYHQKAAQGILNGLNVFFSK